MLPTSIVGGVLAVCGAVFLSHDVLNGWFLGDFDGAKYRFIWGFGATLVIAVLIWQRPVVGVGDDILIKDYWRYARIPRSMVREVIGDLDEGLVIYAGGRVFLNSHYWSLSRSLMPRSWALRLGWDRRYAEAARNIEEWCRAGREGEPVFGSVPIENGRPAGKHSQMMYLPPSELVPKWRIRPFAMFWLPFCFVGVPIILANTGLS
ncbi:hypothetical protein VR010_11130 [Actinomycetaceae bacterium L2_0104]